MKILAFSIVVLLLLISGCQMEPDYGEVSKEGLLAPYIELYGDVVEERVTKYYENGMERNVAVYWNYEVVADPIYESTNQVFIIIWYNDNPFNSSWDYGWNLLNDEVYIQNVL